MKIINKFIDTLSKVKTWVKANIRRLIYANYVCWVVFWTISALIAMIVDTLMTPINIVIEVFQIIRFKTYKKFKAIYKK